MERGRQGPDRRPGELQPAQRQLRTDKICQLEQRPLPPAQKHLVPITAPSSRDPLDSHIPFSKTSALLLNSVSLLCTDLYYRRFASIYSLGVFFGVFFYKAFDFQAFDLAAQDTSNWLAKI